MATFVPVSRELPLNQRSTLITDVEEGDRINIVEILGRPAKKVKFILTDAADEITWKQNHLQLKRSRVPVDYYPQTVMEQASGVYERPKIEFWNQGETFPAFTTIGEEIILSDTKVASLEIVGLTLNTGTTISIQIE